ncbi:hypothetical protein Q0N40_00650 [Corynebacterium pseudokroppenstedtii]|uniref:Type II toxin-antitoxin system HicB family antitoxin n=1 Tax=Corynebacterium pseudokroppenstedtii TaxID=2804917 RepID=A0AAU0PZW8_9CORY|nr:hypothetical protein [Corynebacterium pseudokroppenstedtii]HJD69646.1 hypothetical protein [Corynebacterium kroppenstedtii]MBY0791297.1 hypothetical protein [Corynebacterium pseudokroppenstedtii]MCF6793544.1 hypothetical protein [Corynebacterium pseudokroppenstedtii]MCF8702830.1 hypothetical protein [Corynebacterium pseudokroppenstedtii]MCG2636571.1 hypothetical protein [Corynebacterium pseudokroppenstedtii]
MTIHVHATVEPDGEWWLVTIPKYDIFGQANRREDAEAVAKEIAALWFDTEEENIEVTLDN